MSILRGRSIALTICALALAGGTSSAAGTFVPDAPQSCRTAPSTILHRTFSEFGSTASGTKWAVVRITVDKDGFVGAKRLIWQSGDDAFNTASLSAAGRTAFSPASTACIALPSTFDYAFIAVPGGKRMTTILPSMAPGVAMRSYSM